MLTQRGRQHILNVFFTQCLYSSSFLRHPVPNISTAPTSFPPVLIRGSSSSSTQMALASITAQTCHYHQLALRDAFLHQTYVWFQAFPSLTVTLSFLTHFWAIDSCFWSLCEVFHYHPNIWLSNESFHAFLHPAFPVASASLLHFSFCVNFSVSELTSGFRKIVCPCLFCTPLCTIYIDFC